MSGASRAGVARARAPAGDRKGLGCLYHGADDTLFGEAARSVEGVQPWQLQRISVLQKRARARSLSSVLTNHDLYWNTIL